MPKQKEKVINRKGQVKARCPLCGYRFECQEASSCPACPLVRTCRLLTCPNCGYKFPRLR